MSNIYATHKPEAGGDNSIYLKIKDGEVARLRIASEPAYFESENKNEDGTTRISTRYAWIVYTKEIKVGDNPAKQVNQAQIFEQSATFFRQLAGFAQDDDYGDPTTYDIKVKREGTGLDTTYQIMPGTNKEPLGVAELDATKKIDLIGKLEASPFYQHVKWLAELEGDTAAPAAPAPTEAKGPTTSEQAKIKTANEKALEDFGGEEIDLSNIPF